MVEILMAIEMDIADQEGRLADLYHRWLGNKIAKPAKPTSAEAVSA